jgi:hypothetical protein
MISVEEQKQLDSNMKRVGMFHALRKMNVFVQEVENEKRLEAKAIKIALVIFGVIGVVTLIYLLMGSSRAKSPHVASEHFTNYANVLTMQVQAKLGKSCINLIETGSQSAGSILAVHLTIAWVKVNLSSLTWLGDERWKAKSCIGTCWVSMSLGR